MTVFKEFFEVTGAAELTRAREFAARRQEAHDAQWKLVKQLGADGYRPGPAGGIKSLLYPKGVTPPNGLRKVGTDKGRNEFQPAGNKKAGKELRTKLAAAPSVEDWGRFADTFGWDGRSPIDCSAGRIYHAHGVHLLRPTERFFLQFPRVLNDGWKAPPGITEVRESDMLRAIEDHNAAAKAARETRQKAA